MKLHKNDMAGWVLVLCLVWFFLPLHAQQPVKLNLKSTIELANDSSLSAFRYQNMYLSGYWEYRTYKANRLPSLTLNLMPAQYYRYITQRYDSNTDMDVFWYRKADKELSFASSMVRFRLSLTGCCAWRGKKNQTKQRTSTHPVLSFLYNFIILCFFMFTINEPIN